MTQPSFPPLMQGVELPPSARPFAHAVEQARIGTDAGLIAWRLHQGLLSAALVLTPETPLSDSIGAVFAVANGFADAFGVLAPPELPLHMGWPGSFRINGGRCGGMRAAASTTDPDAVPDWLIVGFDLPFLRIAADEPGRSPDDTALHEEGCGDIDPIQLLETWSRHSLVWLNTFQDEGWRRVHQDWLGRSWGKGEEIDITLPGQTVSGIFTGLDERGGMVLKEAGGTRLIPLTAMLET